MEPVCYFKPYTVIHFVPQTLIELTQVGFALTCTGETTITVVAFIAVATGLPLVPVAAMAPVCFATDWISLVPLTVVGWCLEYAGV